MAAAPGGAGGSLSTVITQRSKETLRARVHRVRFALGWAAQAAVAAGLAWFVAHDLLGHVLPFFAPIAAVMVLAVSIGQRLRRAFEVVAGNAVGILLGEALILVIGRGAWQVSLVVLLAIVLAVFVGGSGPLVTQAATSASLVASLTPFGSDYFFSRFVDAVVGGSVGIAVMALLLPLNPLTVVQRAAGPVLEALVKGLSDTADALERRDGELASQALEQLRDAETKLGAFNDSLNAGREISRVAPMRWGKRGRAGPICGVLQPCGARVAQHAGPGAPRAGDGRRRRGDAAEPDRGHPLPRGVGCPAAAGAGRGRGTRTCPGGCPGRGEGLCRGLSGRPRLLRWRGSGADPFRCKRSASPRQGWLQKKRIVWCVQFGCQGVNERVDVGLGGAQADARPQSRSGNTSPTRSHARLAQKPAGQRVGAKKPVADADLILLAEDLGDLRRVPSLDREGDHAYPARIAGENPQLLDVVYFGQSVAQPVEQALLLLEEGLPVCRFERRAYLRQGHGAEQIRGSRLVPGRAGGPPDVVGGIADASRRPAAQGPRRGGVEPVAAADENPGPERCIELVTGQGQIVDAGSGKVDRHVRCELGGVDGYPGTVPVRDHGQLARSARSRR